MGNRGRPRHGHQSAKGTGSGADGSYGASAATDDTQEPRGGDGTRAGRPATGGRAERRRQA
ncbi:signal peptidase I, partial [Streptomyces inhibens]